MAAVLATALSFGSAAAARFDYSATAASARPVRLVRRWVLDPATNRLVCTWAPDREPRRPILHLRLVQA